VYFTIYPLHEVNPLGPDVIKYKAEVEWFKEYLNIKGPVFVNVEELKFFYLLPYIPDPKACPLFNNIFTSKWISDLRKSLKEVLRKVPNLSESNSSPTESLSSSNGSNLVPSDNIGELLKFSKELLNVTVAALNGKIIDLNFIKIAERKIQQYEITLPQHNKQLPTHQLNYKKIKDFLRTVTDSKAIGDLLKALNLRVWVNKNKGSRANMITNYVKNDLFECKSTCKLLELLLFHDNKFIVQNTLELINTIAIKSIGVLYIANQSKPLELLLKLLFSAVT
jgi:hypothetical protein